MFTTRFSSGSVFSRPCSRRGVRPGVLERPVSAPPIVCRHESASPRPKLYTEENDMRDHTSVSARAPAIGSCARAARWHECTAPTDEPA
jgi:hypothetical protein